MKYISIGEFGPGSVLMNQQGEILIVIDIQSVQDVQKLRLRKNVTAYKTDYRYRILLSDLRIHIIRRDLVGYELA